MIIKPTDIHEDFGKAKLGVQLAAEALGIECNCTLTTMWKVGIDEKERKAFVSLAREEANG